MKAGAVSHPGESEASEAKEEEEEEEDAQTPAPVADVEQPQPDVEVEVEASFLDVASELVAPLSGTNSTLSPPEARQSLWVAPGELQSDDESGGQDSAAGTGSDPAPPSTLDFGFGRDFEARYKTLEVIGRGGYGTVYRCEERNSRHEYAVKVITKTSLCTPQRVARINKEAEIMHELGVSSLSVCTLHHVFEDDENVYLVQELCRGGALWARIKTGQYSELSAAKLLRSVLRVIAQCHARGIIVRDLKPHNFLFRDESDDSPLKLTDFGLADYFDPLQPELETFTDRLGTSHYMAPEVVGRLTTWPPETRYGSRADIWSVGVIAYQLLAGRLPFGQTSNQPLPTALSCSMHQRSSDVFAEIMVGKVDFESEPWPDISEGAKDFVRMLLAREATDRPSAMQAMRHPWIEAAPIEPLSDALCVTISNSLRVSALERIQRFGGYSRLKQAALQAITERHVGDFGNDAVPGGTGDLRALFDLMDPEGTNKIALPSLVDGLQDLGFNIDESEARQLMKVLVDDDQDGVAYTQFVAALVDWQIVKENASEDWNRWVEEAFREFDVDGNGMIDPEEIEAAIFAQETCGNDTFSDAGCFSAEKNGYKSGKTLSLNDWVHMLRLEDGSASLDNYDSRINSDTEC